MEASKCVHATEKTHLHGASAEYSIRICDSTFPASCCTSADACRCCTRSFYVAVKALDNISSTRLFKILRLQSVDAFFEGCLAHIFSSRFQLELVVWRDVPSFDPRCASFVSYLSGHVVFSHSKARRGRHLQSSWRSRARRLGLVERSLTFQTLL